MTHRLIPVVLIGGLLAGGGGSVRAQEPNAWRTLLDRLSPFDNFTSEGTGNWRVADDVVKADGGTGFLVSRDSYGDFDLRVEFWASPDANSGVFLRCSDPQAITATNAYEVNIFDKRPDQTYRTGGIVNVAKVTANVEAGNHWNTMEISARGPKMTVRLNGMLVSEGEDRQFARGPIALQYAAGDIRFRKVEIR